MYKYNSLNQFLVLDLSTEACVDCTYIIFFEFFIFISGGPEPLPSPSRCEDHKHWKETFKPFLYRRNIDITYNINKETGKKSELLSTLLGTSVYNTSNLPGTIYCKLYYCMYIIQIKYIIVSRDWLMESSNWRFPFHMECWVICSEVKI